jgi:hypothetical protein
MNETVKAALLAERQDAHRLLDEHDAELRRLRHRIGHVERAQKFARMRADDIELHLKDNGVDLAAVDAEAARKPSAMQCGLSSGLLGQGYDQARSGLNNGHSNQLRGSLNAVNCFDPTTGLVKALDEA